MKTAWADQKNQNKHSIIDNKKHWQNVTDTAQLACDKEPITVAECATSESDQCASSRNSSQWF